VLPLHWLARARGVAGSGARITLACAVSRIEQIASVKLRQTQCVTVA
jgi:hypothetical protein